MPYRPLHGSGDWLHFWPFRQNLEYDLNMGTNLATYIDTKRDTNDVRSRLRPWLWITSIWLGLGVFDAMQTVFVMRAEGMHHAWVTLFVISVISWLPWALATPLVLLLGRRFPPVTLRPFSAWLAHAGVCASIGLIFAAWTTWLAVFFNPYADAAPHPPFVHLWFDKFYNGILSSLVLYATILAVGYVADSRERLAFQQTEAARLSEQLAKAQLNALRRQIEPHFLFNTLNAVAGLVREGRNDAAVSMIAGLSDFLRRVLEDSTRQQVPLGEEIEFAQKYLDIQKVRFAERLQLSVDVPAELYPAQVPSLILQPMVENAVKHGIAKRARGGAIRIAASRQNGMLTLSVCNDGPSLPADWEMNRSGIGMSNVRTRLHGLYGDAFELSMKNQAAGGVEVLVSLPFVVSSALVSKPDRED
jgi:two-component system LytT family sensor kinase